jgi:hypothetical protein
MADTHSASDTARYPTGITTFAGLLIGAFLGWLLYEIPFGMAAGMAVGVGLDSLLNYWFNGVSAHRDARQIAK